MTVSREQGVSATRKGVLALLMAAVTLVLCLLMAEAVVRVVKRNTAFQPDPELIRSRLPSKQETVRIYEAADTLEGRSRRIPAPAYVEYRPTNNLGLRMVEDVGPKQPGERRILILGDSFAEGMETPLEDHVDGEAEPPRGDRPGAPYDRRFDGVAQKLLDDSPERPGWKIINAAIQNGSPSQYLLMLRWLLPAVQPDLVVVLAGSNDLGDDMTFEGQFGFDRDENGVPIRPHKRLELWLLQKSFLLRYLQVFLFRFHPGVERALFPWQQPLTPFFWDAVACTLQPEARKAFEERTGRFMLDIDRMVVAAGASFGVVVIHYLYSFKNEPFYEARFPALKQRLLEQRCYETNARPYADLIDGFLARNGIPYRDTHAAFLAAKREAPTRKLWNYADYHFSPAGHVLLGQELARFVQELRPSAPVGTREAPRS